MEREREDERKALPRLTTSTPPPQKLIKPPMPLLPCQSKREEDRVFGFEEERAERKREKEEREIMK